MPDPTASDTAPDAKPDSALRGEHATTAAAPERLLLVPVIGAAPGSGGGIRSETARYVLVRWQDWPHPVLLSLAPPAPSDSLDAAVTDLLSARLQLQPVGAARTATRRVPVRMGAPRLGLTGTGWLRAVVVPVAGEPQPDALLAGADVLPLDAALAALTTEVERMLLRDAAVLFDA